MVAPRPMVICGPSGSGKSTLVTRLMEDFPNKFGFSTSHTTREPRPGEEDGVHYHFTDREKMKTGIENGDFIENASFSGNMYGTSKAAVDEIMKKGLICILDIEVQGVKQVKESTLDPHYVFIKPPSIDALKERLEARKTENSQSLEARLSIAMHEIEYGETPGNFDFIIINDELDRAYDDLRTFVTTKVLAN